MKRNNNDDEVANFMSYDPVNGVLIRTRDKGPCKAGEIAGNVRKDGYLQVGFNRKMFLGHRIIWFLCKGYWPTLDIDHIDGNPRNNLISNLREATRAKNVLNQKMHKDNRYGMKGVSKSRNGKKFRARIIINYKEISLGAFDTPEEAHAAYMQAAIRFGGEFARAE
jgi:Demerecviridae HNH endonuclease